MKELRENWNSRAGFVFAAIGSAVGLGNVWRFPYETYANGGGAFLLPYVIAMVSMGIPLLILEFSLGHYTQRSAPFAFGKLNKKLEFIGWWATISSFIIVCYYAVVLAWCLSYLLDSMQCLFTGSELPWKDHASDAFFKEYLGTNSSFAFGGLRMPIVCSLIVVWFSMFLCTFRGIRFVGKLVQIIVPVPWVVLLLLLYRSLKMEGSLTGVDYFLKPNWSKLADVNIWRAAFGHVSFSMSIGFAVMITYSSYLHRKSDINNSALMTGIADLSTSFLAGLTVFATMGAFAFQQHADVTTVLDSAKSIGLAFVAFPEALAHMPAPVFFSVVFFLTLFILGLDSAFSLTEAALGSLIDKTGWSRVKLLAIMSVVGCGLGLIYVTRGGLNWFDMIDSYINEGEFGITFVVLAECVALSWFCNLRELQAHANKSSDWYLGTWWLLMIRYILPAILIILIGWGLYDKFTSGKGFIIDSDDQLIGRDIFGLAMNAAAILLSIILALWPDVKFKSIKEVE